MLQTAPVRITTSLIVENMGETLTAIKLANAPEWSQLWTDSTTRRQIQFAALIVGGQEKEELLREKNLEDAIKSS
jgi:hypothetical protein